MHSSHSFRGKIVCTGLGVLLLHFLRHRVATDHETWASILHLIATDHRFSLNERLTTRSTNVFDDLYPGNTVSLVLVIALYTQARLAYPLLRVVGKVSCTVAPTQIIQE